MHSPTLRVFMLGQKTLTNSMGSQLTQHLALLEKILDDESFWIVTRRCSKILCGYVETKLESARVANRYGLTKTNLANIQGQPIVMMLIQHLVGINEGGKVKSLATLVD